MKPFDLEKAIEGDPVITRNGDPVTQITRFDIITSVFKLYGVVNGCVECWASDGRYGIDLGSFDLFMAPVNRQEWRAVYKTSTEVPGYKISNFSYESEQDVINSRERKDFQEKFVKAILIREWEE